MNIVYYPKLTYIKSYKSKKGGTYPNDITTGYAPPFIMRDIDILESNLYCIRHAVC